MYTSVFKRAMVLGCASLGPDQPEGQGPEGQGPSQGQRASGQGPEARGQRPRARSCGLHFQIGDQNADAAGCIFRS